MHPPFFVVDHRIDPDETPTEERRVIRRNRPEHLRLALPPPDLPLVIYRPAPGPRPRSERPTILVRLFSRLFDKRSPATDPVKEPG